MTISLSRRENELIYHQYENYRIGSFMYSVIHSLSVIFLLSQTNLAIWNLPQLRAMMRMCH